MLFAYVLIVMVMLKPKLTYEIKINILKKP